MQLQNNDPISVVQEKHVELSTQRISKDSTHSLDCLECCFPSPCILKSETHTNSKIKETKICDLQPEGRRIVDLNYFLNRLKELNCHSIPFGCSLNNLILEKKVTEGLRSKLVFHCNMCNQNLKVSTSDLANDSMDINTVAVAGVMSIGSGFGYGRIVSANGTYVLGGPF